MNKYLAELAKLNLIDWPTLVTGINNSWIDKDAISSYAFELLHSGETDEDSQRRRSFRATGKIMQKKQY
jgi:hypothetical protein